MSGGRSMLAWIAVAPLAVWALLRISGLAVGFPFVQLLAFTPYAGAAALLLLGVLLGARQWPAAIVGAVTVVVFAACLLPRALGGPDDVAGPTLKIMSVNMWVGQADPEQIVKLVREQHVDVLAVQEFTPEAASALTAAGLRELLPLGELHPADGAGGSGVYSRYPLRAGSVTTNPGGFLQASALVDVPGAAAVRVTSVHPLPPAAGSFMAAWSAGIRAEPPAPAAPDFGVLAGDFNATLDHAELRDLIATGYTDAAAALGKGFTPTWPYQGNRLAITPKVTIDHILVSGGVHVRDYTAIQVAVTDHKAILATLILPVSA